jgi:hypothetical protein
VEKAESFSKGWFAKSVAKENLRRGSREDPGRLEFTTDLAEAVKDVDLVIEAGVDVLAVKRTSGADRRVSMTGRSSQATALHRQLKILRVAKHRKRCDLHSHPAWS